MLSAEDRDLAIRDRSLPGLAILLDPEAFVNLLRPFLPIAAHGTAQIAYIRYKPGTNCLVSYWLEVAGAEGAASKVELYAKAQKLNAWEKFENARKKPNAPGVLGSGRIVLEELGIIVSTFPNDSKLKTLPLVVHPDEQRQLLRQILPEQPQLWESQLRRLRYKPERRYVAQVVNQDQARAVLRVYTRPGYQAVRNCWSQFESRDYLQVASQLGCCDERQILAFEWLSGRSLAAAISDPALGVETMATVGAALAELHSQTSAHLTILNTEAEATRLLATAVGLGRLSPGLASPAETLAQRLAASLHQYSPQYCPIHGDFYADQVLLMDDQAAIVDLDRAVYGDPAADVGLFLAHLERAVLQDTLSPSQMQAWQEALMAGYGEIAPAPSLARVQLYIAIGLLRLAPEPFRYHAPNWPEQSEALLTRAIAIYNRAIRKAG